MEVSPDQPRPSLGKRILHEIKMVWIMTMYFAAGFCLLLLMQNLLLADQGAEQIGYISAVIMAALIGKVIIVIEKMPFTNRFRHRRRIGHIVYSTIVFTVIAQLIGAIEKVIKKMIHGDAFGEAITHVLHDFSPSKFYAVSIALLILFGFLFFVREVNHILGDGVLLKTLFQRPDSA